MTKDEIGDKMNADLREAFKVEEVVDFCFDLMKKGYTKGLELGMQHGYDLCLDAIRKMLDTGTDVNLVVSELVRRKGTMVPELD